MDITKLGGILDTLYKWIQSMSQIDMLQFLIMGILVYMFNKRLFQIKDSVLETVEKRFIVNMNSALDSIANDLKSISGALSKHMHEETGEFKYIHNTIKDSQNEAKEVRDKIFLKLETIEKSQEKYTFLFENASGDMYANRMQNIKLWARQFFTDWKQSLHIFLMNASFKDKESFFNEFFKCAMGELIKWTDTFRQRIHPTHMAIIENEVNPKSIEVFAKRLKENIVPKIFDIKDTKEFQSKSYDIVSGFLDQTSREWEELTEECFRVKRLRNEI